jgi:hypothetical protein
MANLLMKQGCKQHLTETDGPVITTLATSSVLAGTLLIVMGRA